MKGRTEARQRPITFASSLTIMFKQMRGELIQLLAYPAIGD